MSNVAATAALLLAITAGVWSAQDTNTPTPERRAARHRRHALGFDRRRGNPVVRTPQIDRLAVERRAFRAGARYHVDLHGEPGDAADGTVHVAARHHGVRQAAVAGRVRGGPIPGVLGEPATGPGYVGKYGVGAPRDGDFDFLRAYEGTHWIAEANGSRVHVTEKNARDAIDFLRARPRTGRSR